MRWLVDTFCWKMPCPSIDVATVMNIDDKEQMQHLTQGNEVCFSTYKGKAAEPWVDDWFTRSSHSHNVHLRNASVILLHTCGGDQSAVTCWGLSAGCLSTYRRGRATAGPRLLFCHLCLLSEDAEADNGNMPGVNEGNYQYSIKHSRRQQRPTGCRLIIGQIVKSIPERSSFSHLDGSFI